MTTNYSFLLLPAPGGSRLCRLGDLKLRYQLSSFLRSQLRKNPFLIRI